MTHLERPWEGPFDAIDTIDQVIARLQAIVAWAQGQPSRIGYFAALYLRVTATIRSRLGTGFFDDDARMERMDILFAKRYFVALEQFHRNDPALLGSWRLALDAAGDDELIIVQHLLAAMNPHINIDLATAAAELCPGDSIHTFEADFNKINAVLATLVPTVVGEIDDVSPWIRLTLDLADEAAIALINFSMDEARDFAWSMAVRLAHLDADRQWALIAEKDQLITALGREVLAPGDPWQALLEVVRAPESDDVRLNIGVLDRGNPLPEHPAPPSATGEPPNRVYYFEIAEGAWTGTFTFRLTSWRRLWASGIGFKNKLLVSAMALWQAILGDSQITSTIEIFPDRGEAGVAHNTFRIARGWFTLFTSSEDYILSANGSGVTVDGQVRFGPLPFLFREHDVYPAVIFDGGFRALYFIRLLGGRFLGKYRVRADRQQVHSLLENDWAVADELLDRVTPSD